MADAIVEGLRVENHERGLGIGEERPRLSWRVSAPPGWAQQGYDVEIARDGVTEHHEVPGADQLYVPWPSDPLAPREAVTVRVRVRGADDVRSAWSAPLPVERAIAPGDWCAVPVSGPGDTHPGTDRRPWLVRRAFTVSGPVARARLYATAHGVFEAELNGVRVGDEVLAPGWTPYHRRLRYRTHDVTDLLAAGDNVLGAWLGDGWYRGRLGFHGGHHDLYGSDQSFLAQLEVTYADGRREVVATDPDWRAAPSPILSSGLYDGETVDAREARPGWSTPGGDERGWMPVVTGHRDPATLEPDAGPPVRCTQVVAPVATTPRGDGRVLVDLGQNLVGRVRLSTRGPRGARLVLRHAEVLQDGELCTRPLRDARATDTYVLSGEGEEVWEPRFTVHGFRHLEIRGDPDVVAATRVEARVLHTDMARRGWFSCSDDDLSRLHENVVWSMRGNAVDVPTDCPQRDERLGWTGDIQVFAPTASLLYDTTGWLSSWLRDLALEQAEDGTAPWYVPVIPGGEMWTPLRPGAAWGDAAVLTPWDVFAACGDPAVLARQWDSARAWVDLLLARAGDDHLWTGDFQLGDWLDPAAPPDDPAAGTTDRDLVASAYLARSTACLADIAAVLGRDRDAASYRDHAAATRRAIARRWLDADGRLDGESQTGYALLLAFDLLDDPAHRAVAGRRLRALVEQAGYRIATGFVGTPLVSRALAEAGELDTAYRQLLERSCPSWLYPVTAGATTIWERWDSLLPDGTVNPGEMTSFNHYALGAVAQWLYSTVAGLAPAAPGWRRIRFAPRPGGGLTWARARHDSPYGTVAIGWEIVDGELVVATTVPTGTTAELDLPDGTRVTLGPGHHEHRSARAAA